MKKMCLWALFLSSMVSIDVKAEDNTSSIPGVCQKESHCQPCCEKVLNSRGAKESAERTTEQVKAPSGNQTIEAK